MRTTGQMLGCKPFDQPRLSDPRPRRRPRYCAAAAFARAAPVSGQFSKLGITPDERREVGRQLFEQYRYLTCIPGLHNHLPGTMPVSEPTYILHIQVDTAKQRGYQAVRLIGDDNTTRQGESLQTCC